jgi:hypothetical protein
MTTTVKIQNAPLATLPKLESAEDVASKLRGVLSAARLRELAGAGYLPCWWIDDTAWFHTNDVKTWVANSHATRQQGLPFPVVLPVASDAFFKTAQNVPSSLLAVAAHLQNVVPLRVSGVYFLILNNEVVYCGQSISVFSRVESHLAERLKIFDRAFYLPVPESDLDRVEGAFIQLLKPPLNGPGPYCQDFESVLKPLLKKEM